MTLGITTPGGGQELTSSELYNQIYTSLVQGAILPNIPGVRVIHTQGLPFRIPILRTSEITGADWYSEGALITETTTATGEATLLPPSLKSLKIWQRLTNELLSAALAAGLDRGGAVGPSSTFGLILAEALALRVSAGIDAALIGGDGTSNTVTGLANAVGVHTIAVGGALSADEVFDAQALVLGSGGKPSVVIMSPTIYNSLRKIKTTTGAYLIEPSVQVGGFATLAGMNVYVTPHAPVDRVVIFDPKAVVVASSNAGAVAIFGETLAQSDETAVRVTTRWDVAAVLPEAVTILTGITTS